MNKKFEPSFYYINGEYFRYSLINDGVSVRPTLTKIKETVLTIVHDMNDDMKMDIPKFVQFALVPENNKEKYSREIDFGDQLKNFNLYELPFHPEGKHEMDESRKVNWPNILNLLIHIAPNVKPFPNSQFTYTQLLFDYLVIAWKYPCQRLPILVLASKERSTGKSTFLQFLELMFQENARMVSVTELGSQFNGGWGLANFVLIDEAKIPDSLLFKIRNESTSKNRIINNKFRQPFQIPNYSKYVMATNEVDNFAKIEDEENRYFIIEVKPFGQQKENKDYFALMKEELPHFLDYLMNHHIMATENRTRFWFDYELYKTPLLKKIALNLKSSFHNSVLKRLREVFETHLHSEPDNSLLEFSITGIREYFSLGKEKEKDIKASLLYLGFNSDDYKKRFLCYFSGKQVNAKRFRITIGELKSIYSSCTHEQICKAEISI